MLTWIVTITIIASVINAWHTWVRLDEVDALVIHTKDRLWEAEKEIRKLKGQSQ